jgi:hypothetical protein
LATPNPVSVRFFVDDVGGESNPRAQMDTGTHLVEAWGSSFGWREGGGTGGSTITDVEGPSFDQWYEVPAGAPIVIGGSAVHVTGWVDFCCDDSLPPPHRNQLDVEQGATIPGEVGRFVLEFSATWPEGDRMFLFPIRVVAPPSGAAATLTLQSDPRPSAALTYQGQTARVQNGSYCWSGDASQMCADTVFTPFKDDQYLEIPQGTALAIDDGGADVIVGGAPGDDPIHQTGSVMPIGDTLDTAGAYILIVSASWQQGDVQFFFPVRVVPSATRTESQAPPVDDFTMVATIAAPADGSPPGLTLGYEGVEKGYPGAGRWDGETVAVVSMLFTFEQQLPTGATLAVTGDADRVEAQIAPARGEAGWGDPVPLDVSSGQATLPSDPGGYLLELDGWWPQGHMGYSVGITIGHPSEPSVSPLPSVEAGVVPDVVGLGEGDARKLLSQAGYETSVRYAPIPGVAAGIVDSMAPGPGTPASAGFGVLLRVSGTDVPLDGYLTQLNCSQADMMPFADDGARDLPTPPTYITVNLPGFQDGDELNQIRFDNSEFPGAGIWQASRDGEVIAVIAVPSLDGIACRGSGIGGV